MRTPVDFAVVSSAIDVGFYIRELMVDADVDTGIYDQIRRKWMENKEKDCFDDLVNLEQAGTMLEGDFLH